MADVDGKIVLGLDIAQTTDQMNRDLDKVLKSIGKKEIILSPNIKTDDVKKQLDGIKGKNIDVKVNGQQATKNIQEVEKRLASASNQSKSFEQTIRNALNIGSAAAVTIKAIQMIRSAAKEAVDAVKDFDGAITDLRTATGQNYETVKKWVVGYNQMGQALGATTTEVADSANTWLRQGRTVAEANSLIETTMVLSKVGMLDSADAAEYLTSAMKGYQVAVEDVAGIVDKLTSVDAHAAVSAGDLAEAMSQTAVTAADAGISMDKLLGYLAAVGEVTQKDMSSIGNAFKTIFTRMSDIKSGKLELIDEDGTTEILSDVETILNNLNIKLRDSDNEFRNFGDVLDEVAAKWDTYSDVQQAALGKAFAGTRQQENFRVLMANYDKAREYMDIAADSAGSAEKKFSAYLDSIEAKTKSLQAAFESLAVNTFSTEMFGGIIEATTGLVEFLDKTNLVKAALISLGAAGVIKGFTVIATGISNAAIKLNEFNAALKMVKVGNLGENEIAQLSKMTANLSQSQLKAVLSSKALSAEQRIAILTSSGMTEAEAAQTLATMGLTTAEGAATTATFSLSGAFKGLWATLMANPLTLVIAAVTAAVSIYSSYKQKLEEVKQAALDAGEAAKDEANNVKNLYATYQKANSAYKSNVGSKEDLESATDDLLAALGCERSEIEKLVEEYGNLDKAIDSVTRKSLEESASKILSAYEAAKNEALSDASDSMGFFSQSSITVKTNGDAKKFAEVLQDAGYLGSGKLPALSTSMYTGINDYDDFDSLVDGYEKLLEIKEALESGIGTKYTAEELSQAKVYTDIAAKINAVADSISNVNDYVKEYNNIQAQLSYMDYVDANGIPETQEQYEALKQSMLDTADASGRYLGTQDDIESSIINALALMPELQDLVTTPENLAEGVSTYKAELAELTDILSDLQSAYDVLATAQEEMAGGGGLSPDTIADLAEAEENYLDYLYEENGVVKLNTEAWKENADAKMQNEMAEIQKEIDSLEEQNAALRENISYYEEQRKLGSDGGLWSNLIAEATADINEKDRKSVV